MTSTIERPTEAPKDDAPNKKKPRYTRKQQVIAGGAAVLTLIGISAGAKFGIDAMNQAPAPVAEQPLEPTVQPEVTPEPAPSEIAPTTLEMPQSEIDRYESLVASGEFYSLPKKEQLTYWTHLASGIRTFADEYRLTSDNSTDVLPTPSINNNIYEIQNLDAFMKRYALSLDIDSDDAEAAMYAIFYNNDGEAYLTWADYLEKFPVAMSGRTQGDKGIVPKTEILNEAEQPPIQYSPDGQPFVEMTSRSDNGEVVTKKLFWIELDVSYLEGFDGVWVSE